MKTFFAHGLSAACLLASGVGAQAAALNTELLVNGNAETGTTAGWVSTGIDAVSVNGSVKPGTAGLPPGTDLGSFAFYAGTGPSAAQTLAQSVDVGSFAALIDAGHALSRFSILIQSRTDGINTDRITGELHFLGAGQTLLFTLPFSDPHIVTAFDWAVINDERAVPVGTRTIALLLTATRAVGTQTDVFADNASLMLTSAVPEPATAWLMLAGLPWLVLRQRRACRLG